MTGGSGTIAVFARTPERGKVKTRLIPALGAVAACAAHETLLLEQLERLRALPNRRELWVTHANADMNTLAANTGCVLREQHGADLGERMAHALQCMLVEQMGAEQVLTEPGADASALLIGSDCPGIDAEYIDAAWRALAHNDVVLGPAEDGGYGLIGVRNTVPELFDEVRWGSAEVLAQTQELAAAAGCDVHLLEPIWDVDDFADWQRYQQWRDTR